MQRRTLQINLLWLPSKIVVLRLKMNIGKWKNRVSDRHRRIVESIFYKKRIFGEYASAINLSYIE
jgi:hypothetical protein